MTRTLTLRFGRRAAPFESRRAGQAAWLPLLVFFIACCAPAAFPQSIDVREYVLPVDPAHHGAEIAEIHPAFDVDPRAADFGGKHIPALWRSNGLVTGLMGIVRFGPAIPAFLSWTELAPDGSPPRSGNRYCPPFYPAASGLPPAQMTRMQSDAITVRYEPFPGVQVLQTTIALNAHGLRSRAFVRASRAVRLRVGLHGGVFEQNQTGHVKWPAAPPDGARAEHEGTVYIYGLRGAGDGVFSAELDLQAGQSREVDFAVGFGSGEGAARDSLRSARSDFFDLELARRRKRSEEFFGRVPAFDFGDPRMNLFHRIVWERFRALGENAAGRIPHRFFMGTSAPWGIDGIWLWDAVFQAEVLHYNDQQWAENLLRNVLAQQYESGLVPHWSTPQSRTEISQPPLLSWEALRLYTFHGNRRFMEELYPRLARLHQWFMKERTRAGGLPYWKQPDESGMDNSPAFDEATDAHVDLAAELLADSLALEQMARLLGRKDDIREWRKQAEAWRAALDAMWDSQRRFFFPLKGDRRIPVFGIQGLFPLWDSQLEGARRSALLGHLRNTAEFWSPFPIPTVAMNSPQFMQPKWFANTYASPESGQMIGSRLENYSSVYWRGPVWVFSNAIVYEALRAAGQLRVANELGGRMIEMMRNATRYGGMLWENFDPMTGRPSRLLPQGQADELAASVYFLKVLYDLRMGLEPAEAPADQRLHLRFTRVPSASVARLRFGEWLISSTVTGRASATLEVEHAPTRPAVIEVENQADAPLTVRFGGRSYPLAPGKKFSAPVAEY